MYFHHAGSSLIGISRERMIALFARPSASAFIRRPDGANHSSYGDGAAYRTVSPCDKWELAFGCVLTLFGIYAALHNFMRLILL